MSDVSGIPYLGIPGMGGGPHFSTFGGSPGVSPAWSADQINASMGMGHGGIGDQNQALLSHLYGPMGFGGQTAMYAGIGAGYGRATGGFGKLPSGADAPAGRVGTIGNPGLFNPGYLDSGPAPGGGGGEAAPTSVSVAPSPFDVRSAGPVPYLSDGGMPFGGGGFGPGPASGPSSASGPMAFKDLWRGRVTPPLPSIDPSISDAAPPPPPTGGLGPGPGFPWGGTGARVGMPSSKQLLGYDPEQSASFAPGSGEGFQGRFGMGLRGAGMPSQYTTDPYRDVEGITYPPNIPPGFQTPFSADNPGGALSAGGLRGMLPPIMNEDWDPSDSADTLTPGDRTAPGGFYGGAFDPAQFKSGAGAGRGSIGGTGGMGSVAAFDTYGLPGGGGMGAFGSRGGGLTAGTGSIGAGDMSNFVSPSNNYNTFQRGASYPWTQQVPGNDPNIMNAVYGAAGKVGADPAALAGMINTESRWNPKANMGKYFGATQMGPDTFKEAGGRLGGMTWDQYKDAPLEKQISAYPDWQQQYGIPGRNEVRGLNIGSYPPPTQAALLQGFQFAPNAGLPGTTNWPGAFMQGNRTMGVTSDPQAPFLSYGQANVPPTMQSMTDYYRRTVGR